MPKCEHCGAEVILPFECNFCGGNFCMEHRLPENHNCSGAPARTPLGPWKSKASSTEKLPKEKEVLISEGDYHFEKKELPKYKLKEEMKQRSVKIGEREPSRLRQILHVNLRLRNLLSSLKFWFVIFWTTVGLLFLVERGNPIQFYHSVPDPVRYALYIFASIIAVWSGYRVFEKCDSNPSSDRGLFALKLLSGAILVLAVFTLVFSIFLLGGLFTEPQLSLGRETASVFLIVVSFALIILSAYLVFKFERRSGIIVYRR